MQIPILSGVYGTEAASFLTSYPKNLEPVFIDTKLSKGYHRAPMGARTFATGPGVDRAGIGWNDQCYRVMGTKLAQVGMSAATTLGDVGGSGYAAMDYSPDRLGIVSGGKLWYWNGTALSQVTDSDLGTVIDLIWVDGYFMLIDGKYIIVTDLSDPTSINPLKYGSADDDPDPLTGLIKVRNEVQAIGRYTIQPFQNVGGNGFPFQAVRGATIPKGCVGPAAKCLLGETFAFVGGGRNEGLGVYVAGAGTAKKVSTEAIDGELARVADPSGISVEQRVSRDEARLYVHLPDRSWVFLAKASEKVGEPVWHEAGSGTNKPYRLRNAVTISGATYCGDALSSNVGVIDDTIMSHFGEQTEWRMDVGLIYNEGRGGILHRLELVGLPGRGAADRATAFLSMSKDAGETWSMERTASIGKRGERQKRVLWEPHSMFSNYMSLRFRGLSDTLPGWAALEAEVEPLNV